MVSGTIPSLVFDSTSGRQRDQGTDRVAYSHAYNLRCTPYVEPGSVVGDPALAPQVMEEEKISWAGSESQKTSALVIVPDPVEDPADMKSDTDTDIRTAPRSFFHVEYVGEELDVSETRVPLPVRAQSDRTKPNTKPGSLSSEAPDATAPATATATHRTIITQKTHSCNAATNTVKSAHWSDLCLHAHYLHVNV